MAQHFLLSKAARDWREADHIGMPEEDARRFFSKIRFAATDGDPSCPHCQSRAIYTYSSRPIFRCKSCDRQFSLTTNTIFAHRKLPFTKIVHALSRFAINAKGMNAIEMSLAIDVQYKTAYVLGQKLREALEIGLDDLLLEGVVEIDGMEIGGHIRPPNVKKTKRDYRKWPHRNTQKKQTVAVAVERFGRAVTFVAKNEAATVPDLAKRIAIGAIVHADSANCFNILHGAFEMRRINHSEAYFTEDASTNNAEAFFSVLRRSAHGVYHRISGANLSLYAAEIAWRHNTRRCGRSIRVEHLGSALSIGTSRRFCNYWQPYKRVKK